jgi:hypothetical protein
VWATRRERIRVVPAAAFVPLRSSRRKAKSAEHPPSTAIGWPAAPSAVCAAAPRGCAGGRSPLRGAKRRSNPWIGYRSSDVQTGIADGVRLIEARLGTATANERSAIKEKLSPLFVEGEKLANDGPPSRQPDEYKKYQAALADWRLRTVQWLNENMAPAAAARFLDWQAQFKPIGFEGAGPQEVWDRDYTFALARNLDLMIQSDAWDKR